MKKKQVAVVGAGASGLTAAVCAARAGARVHLFEKQKSAGRKILASGNGQCNLSNRNAMPGRYHSENPHFIKSILSRYTVDDALDFFASIGVPVREKEDGRIYPFSMQARTVLEALLQELDKTGVTLHLHRRIDSVLPEKGSFTLLTAGKEKHCFDAVILAMGGRTYSSLGGSTRSYELARSLGHSIVEQLPSILPINIPYKKIHILQGLKWDCTLEAESEGKVISTCTDEVLFTKYGISGPASFDISGMVNRAQRQGRIVTIHINFMPELKRDETEMFIVSDASAKLWALAQNFSCYTLPVNAMMIHTSMDNSSIYGKLSSRKSYCI